MKFLTAQSGELLNAERLNIIRVATNIGSEPAPTAAQRRWWVEGTGPEGTFRIGPERNTVALAQADLAKIATDLDKSSSSFLSKLL